jgi:hypothetical protein
MCFVYSRLNFKWRIAPPYPSVTSLPYTKKITVTKTVLTQALILTTVTSSPLNICGEMNQESRREYKRKIWKAFTRRPWFFTCHWQADEWVCWAPFIWVGRVRDESKCQTGLRWSVRYCSWCEKFSCSDWRSFETPKWEIIQFNYLSDWLPAATGSNNRQTLIMYIKITKYPKKNQ